MAADFVILRKKNSSIESFIIFLLLTISIERQHKGKIM